MIFEVFLRHAFASRAARGCRGLARCLGIVAVAIALPATAADMNKVIRHVFPAGEEGFDPAAAHDLYSGTVEQAIFETLLSYDYLARPSKLVPLTAEALPQITDNGQTYTIKLKKGIHFTPDPAFKGSQARARRRRLRLLAEAPHGPGDPLAVGVAARRQDRRARRDRREGEAARQQIRLQTRRFRDSRRSTGTRCASA